MVRIGHEDLISGNRAGAYGSPPIGCGRSSLGVRWPRSLFDHGDRLFETARRANLSKLGQLHFRASLSMPLIAQEKLHQLKWSRAFVPTLPFAAR